MEIKLLLLPCVWRRMLLSYWIADKLVGKSSRWRETQKNVINGYGGRISGYNWTLFLILTQPLSHSISYSSLPRCHWAIVSSLIPNGKQSSLYLLPSFFHLLSLISTLTSFRSSHFCSFCLLSFVSPLFSSSYPFLLLPSFILFSNPLLLGFWPVSRGFLILFRSVPRLPPQCLLIFMQLAGQPCSASLSLFVGEEAAYCQQLMDFWKTQTAMHHSLKN